MRTIYVFSNGSQYTDWTSRNCDRCSKYDPEGEKEFECDIDSALFNAFWDDGKVTEEIAKRMGYQPGLYTWACPELAKPQPPAPRLSEEEKMLAAGYATLPGF
jgi:hypothetical protein